MKTGRCICSLQRTRESHTPLHLYTHIPSLFNECVCTHFMADSVSFMVFLCVFRFRIWCQNLISHKLFDHVVLVFIFLNCITIALERPDIQPHSTVRHTHTHTHCAEQKDKNGRLNVLSSTVLHIFLDTEGLPSTSLEPHKGFSDSYITVNTLAPLS